MSECAIRSGSGEPLRKSSRSSSRKVRVAVELEGSAEVAGKEIVDPLNIQIESEFIFVRTLLVGHTFHELKSSGVRITRAEIIPSDLQHQCSCLANLCLRRRRIRRTGLVVAGTTES